MWKERFLPIAAGLSIALLVFSAMSFVAGRGWLFGVEATVYDHWLRQLPKAASSDCVIVYVSERDIQAWDQYPMSDLKMAELLTRLSAMGPRVIGIDIFRDIKTPDQLRQTIDRERLDRVLASTATTQPAGPPIVAGYLLASGNDKGVAPPPVVADDESKQGFVNFGDDEQDRVLRSAILFKEDPGHPGKVRSSLAVNLVSQFLASDAADQALDALPGLDRAVGLFYHPRSTSHSAVTATAGKEILLDFRGPGRFPRYDIQDVLGGAMPARAIKDKIVIIGVITPSIKDYVTTPYDQKLPGVQMHAQICDQLLRTVAGQPTMASSPRGRQAMLAAAVGLLGWAIGWWVRAPWKAVLSLAVLCTSVWWGGWWSLLHSKYAGVVPPILNAGVTTGLVTSYRSYRERADRQVMDGLVDRMMSKRIARTLWSRRGELLENGHLKPQVADATVLFSDLQGFTDISERLDADVLLKWLNTYFQTMSDLVETHAGVVNKYVGDQVMAVFGPPLPSFGQEAARTNARNGIRCALAMRGALAELQELWDGHTLELSGWTSTETAQLRAAMDDTGRRLRIRIGIASGKLVAGSLGSRARFEYTVIGATVNLASRLEAWDKGRMDAAVAPGHCRILINRDAFELTASDFITQHLGPHAVRGMEDPVDIYSVLGHAPSTEPT